MLIPSTWTHRLTRAYTSTLNTPQVFHKQAPAVLFGKQLLCGGLLLHRHNTPLTRRFVVYYCSALYRRKLAGTYRACRPRGGLCGGRVFAREDSKPAHTRRV